MITAASEEILIRPLLKGDKISDALPFVTKTACFDDEESCFGIYLREDETFLGVCLCPEKTGQIILSLKEEYRDQGYGHQALTLCLDLLFGVYGRREVVAEWDLSLPAALKTLLSCGFETDSDGFYRLTESRWELL